MAKLANFDTNVGNFDQNLAIFSVKTQHEMPKMPSFDQKVNKSNS